MVSSYFGITGFTKSDQIEAVLNSLPATLPRKFMVGVLASSKTLAGIPKKNPNRSPDPAEIGNIFRSDDRCFNLIHYNYERGTEWVAEMSRLVELGGPNLHGFQINAPWPKKERLGAFRRAYPHIKIVLQISENAMAIASGFNSPDYCETSKWAYPYVAENLVDYLLIDPSGGKGLLFDPAVGLSRIGCLRRECGHEIGMGIAGGLKTSTLDQIIGFVNQYPEICWDAEGGLRDSEDNLDLQEAISYAIKSVEIAS